MIYPCVVNRCKDSCYFSTDGWYVLTANPSRCGSEVSNVRGPFPTRERALRNMANWILRNVK